LAEPTEEERRRIYQEGMDRFEAHQRLLARKKTPKLLSGDWITCLSFLGVLAIIVVIA